MNRESVSITPFILLFFLIDVVFYQLQKNEIIGWCSLL